MLVGVLVGLLVGFVGMACLSPKLRKRSKETRVAFARWQASRALLEHSTSSSRS